MSQNGSSKSQNVTLVVSAREYFLQAIDEACTSRGLKAAPLARNYLAEMLDFYTASSNFLGESDEQGRHKNLTLAEMFLTASNAEPRVRFELLKKMADRSLYISGFFGDSLQRKLVDLDYYAEMGGAAYSVLAKETAEDLLVKVFTDFSENFVSYADVLSHIQGKAQNQREQNILQLFERYEKTGSEYARDRLLEMGIIAGARQRGKQNRQ